MTLWGRLTVYRIRRDHSNRIGVFVVNVPEVHQYGVGAQVRFQGMVYGISLHTRRS